jgi:uncharacterized membrane protein YfcA
VTADRIYSVRRPLAAFLLGAAVAVLGGLIGLGGAEFRLPLLIAVFELFPHRAIRINLLISLATLAASAGSRLSFVPTVSLMDHRVEIAAMLGGGVLAAWIGAGVLVRIPKRRIIIVIATLLAAIAGLLVLETAFAGSTGLMLADDKLLRTPIAVLGGLMVGAVSSLIGVAGGELIIPMLIFIFGMDIKAAGTASVLISLPIVVTGVARHWFSGYYRSRSVFTLLTLPMSLGSLLGALVGAYMAAWVDSGALRLVLASIIGISAVKLLVKRETFNENAARRRALD